MKQKATVLVTGGGSEGGKSHGRGGNGGNGMFYAPSQGGGSHESPTRQKDTMKLRHVLFDSNPKVGWVWVMSPCFCYDHNSKRWEMGMLILPFFSPSREELTLGRVRTGEKQDFTFYKKITLPGTRDPNCLLAHLTPHIIIIIIKMFIRLFERQSSREERERSGWDCPV